MSWEWEIIAYEYFPFLVFASTCQHKAEEKCTHPANNGGKCLHTICPFKHVWEVN